jgi:DNA topoisomerase-1
MSKKYSTTTTLVIVESPAKCKKIEEYLGPGYKCLASFGHLRELLSLKNIDIDNNFNPTYTVIENALKKKQVELLRKEIKSASQVILATDDDREGEAIAWHLCELFKLDVNKTKRITFNEITESALKEAIKNPRTIDMNVVHAQQARQILDILVGFKVSPIMWKLIKKNKENSLSAGRCQTPALRLVYDNDKDIKNIAKIIKNNLNRTK